MKITAQEEFGFRIMIRIASSNGGITISDISELEGISHANVAKICRVLRMGQFIDSKKGHTGGYELARPAQEINIGHLLRYLGGPLYDENYCGRFTPELSICTNSLDCSVRSLWKLLQNGIEDILGRLYLSDFLEKEAQIKKRICSSEVNSRPSEFDL